MSSITNSKAAPVRSRIPNGILGMVLLLFTEIMFFSGLISSYIVNRADVLEWPPVNQPRLPIEITAINTVILLASAFFFFQVLKRYRAKKNYMAPLYIAIIMGSVFLAIQGKEWVELIGYGLTTSSSLYGAFFYTIIGMHAIHVMIGLGFLFFLVRRLKAASNTNKDMSDKIQAVGLFWYFVVGIWPLLYYLVYLS